MLHLICSIEAKKYNMHHQQSFIIILSLTLRAMKYNILIPSILKLCLANVIHSFKSLKNILICKI